MKLITFFLILIAVQATLVLYGDTTPESTDIWTFVTNLDNWTNLTFILTFVGIAGGIGLVGIAAGSIFGFKTDFLLLAPAVAGFVYMGVILVNLGRAIRQELLSRIFTDCSAIFGSITDCAPVNFILAITLGPIAFYYVWTVWDWWRSRDN